MTGHVGVVIVAAGDGARMGTDRAKQFLDLGGLPMLDWSIRAFQGHPDIDELVIVLAPGVLAKLPPWLARDALTLVAGGTSRRESVSCGVASVNADSRIILVHDAARPFVSAAVIDRVLAAAAAACVVPVLPLKDTVKETNEMGRVVGTPDRSRLHAAQTPQGFPAAVIRSVHDDAARAATDATDDAELCELRGETVITVRGDELNFKITTMEDIRYAEWLVETGGVGPAPAAAGAGRGDS